MTQLAITDELAATLVRRRPGRRTYRTFWMPLEDFLQVVDVEAAKKIERRVRPRKQEPFHREGWRFRDAFTEQFPDLANVDVLIERGEPEKLGIRGGNRRAFADIARGGCKPNLELGKRMWSHLTYDWCDPYNLGVAHEQYLEAELGMWKLKLPVEQADVRYQYGFWVAHSLALGEEIKGGTCYTELRRKPGSKERKL